ncbi:MAG: DoxX family protein [Pseudonocardiales bacterium]
METMTPGGSVPVTSLFRRSDVALLLLRATIGVVFIAHGAQKLFGAFGGRGLDGVANTMAGLGLKPGMFFAVLSGVLEFGGGLLLVVGLFTSLVGLLLSGVMVMAIALVTGANGFIVPGGVGYEFNVVLIAAALTLVLAGPGQLSLDHRLGLADRIRQMRTKRS